jgi:hypothetical protein
MQELGVCEKDIFQMENPRPLILEGHDFHVIWWY